MCDLSVAAADLGVISHSLLPLPLSSLTPVLIKVDAVTTSSFISPFPSSLRYMEVEVVLQQAESISD